MRDTFIVARDPERVEIFVLLRVVTPDSVERSAKIFDTAPEREVTVEVRVLRAPERDARFIFVFVRDPEIVATVDPRVARDPEIVEIVVLRVDTTLESELRDPERDDIFPVAVARLAFVVARSFVRMMRLPESVFTVLVSPARVPERVEIFVFIPATIPESAFCARESVK